MLELAAVCQESDELPPFTVVSETLQLTQSSRHIATKTIPCKAKSCKTREVGERRWDSSTESVVRKAKNFHSGEHIADISSDSPRQHVYSYLQICQRGQIVQGVRKHIGEDVVIEHKELEAS
nr:unnamed protein product [Digitaria exilis]